MKNIKYTTIFFFLILLACQEETPQLPKKVAISTEKEMISSHFSMKTFSPRKKIEKSKVNKNLDFSAYLQNSENLIPPPFARENSVAAAEKGCAKIKKVINRYPDFGYDETATITYRAVNLIDYIDYEYSDDPSYNGRMTFAYSTNGQTLTISFTPKTGAVRADKDIVKLNAKGYAVEWLHDLTNFRYENPYTEKIEYNAQGFPTRFTEIYEGKIITDDVVKYTKEINFETVTVFIAPGPFGVSIIAVVISVINWLKVSIKETPPHFILIFSTSLHRSTTASVFNPSIIPTITLLLSFG